MAGSAIYSFLNVQIIFNVISVSVLLVLYRITYDTLIIFSKQNNSEVIVKTHKPRLCRTVFWSVIHTVIGSEKQILHLKINTNNVC